MEDFPFRFSILLISVLISFAVEILLMGIKNIIFDLGGVLLNLDFSKTSAAFAALGIENFNEYFTQDHANSLFRKLETGEIIDEAFYTQLRNTANIMAENKAIDLAWNAMLLDFSGERIERLKTLSKEYRLFLFSNTNAIHYVAFHSKFEEQFGFGLDILFEKTYYSHQIGHRKPDIAAFEYVIAESNIKPASTLFIDDTYPNIEAAGKAGLQAAHVHPGRDLLELLDETLRS